MTRVFVIALKLDEVFDNYHIIKEYINMGFVTNVRFEMDSNTFYKG